MSSHRVTPDGNATFRYGDVEISASESEAKLICRIIDLVDQNYAKDADHQRQVKVLQAAITAHRAEIAQLEDDLVTHRQLVADLTIQIMRLNGTVGDTWTSGISPNF